MNLFITFMNDEFWFNILIAYLLNTVTMNTLQSKLQCHSCF